MGTSSKLLTGIAAMALSLYAQAYPGEGIALDPATGDYTITYRGDPGSTELSQTVYVPSTKIAPAIRSSFRQDERGMIVYRYTVSNDATAKQAIIAVALDQIVNPVVGELSFPDDPSKAVVDEYNTATRTALASPSTWEGDITRFRIATHGEDLDRIAWMPKSDDINAGGIQAGHTLTGFGFSSLALPGVGPSLTSGFGEVLSFSDEGPLEDSAVFAELNSLRDNHFVSRPAAVPTIAVPVPFDAAVLLDSIRAHVSTWPGKQLLDPSFATQLDRYMVAAADAYRRNQPKTGKKHIQTMRELIKKEHADADGEDDKDDRDEKGDDRDKNKRALIDKLAARILDFDLKYVAKRMGGDRDD